jgi:LuxR family quorum sensing-dependent transcriptional regulator
MQRSVSVADLDPIPVVEQLLRNRSMDDLARRFAEAIAPLGMTAAASGMVTGPRGLSDNPFHFVNWPAAWMEIYQARGFVKIDPLPRWAMVSGEPVSWTEIIARLPATDPGLEVPRAAAAFGFREGFVTPVRTRTGALGLVSVGGGERPAFQLQERIFLQVISGATLMHAESLIDAPAAPASPFTLREQECIALLRQGFTDAEIGTTLGVALTTVRAHLQNARRKAGARNRVELAGR